MVAVIFGHGLSVAAFQPIDEAIEIGNEPVYALGADVRSRHLSEFMRERTANGAASDGAY